MQRYPDILNNPDSDPRVTQQQYEDWHREQMKYEEKDNQKIQRIEDR